jgi:3-hydroxybutyryl-CoA dehydrogenase
MGSGIAQVATEAGLHVLIHDPVDGAGDRALERIGGFLHRKAEKGQLSNEESAMALARIEAVSDPEALTAADLVVEAIPEQLGLKLDAFRRLDAAAPPATILASNTSSLSIARIAAAKQHPGRVLGMHFFNPVPLMALVEVVVGPMTEPAVVDAVALTARVLGKTTVVAADTPGFIVNRVARPFYLEALRLVGEGLAGVEAVDEALRDAGFKMGPFELIDAIGADVNLAVSESIFEQFFYDPRYRPHPIQRMLVAAGRLGRKAGGGFYDYTADGERGGTWGPIGRRPAGPAHPTLSSDQIAVRMIALLVNEAASAVAEAVATPEAIDIAMRLGTSYPHGPLEWGERIGLTTVVRTLDGLHAAVPDGRYRVVPLLRSLAEHKASFFGSR